MEHMLPCPRGYTPIAGGYAFALLRVGLVLMDLRTGREVYFQPGDDTAVMLENIASLDEVLERRRSGVAEMIIGEYFA